ncbi:Transcriptional activator of proteases prtT [Fusarium oxysporum f. sp. raphani]|nr:Transcriptional activator of proteases prtT [Fusarium oxysporum f. sp. raphani]
MSNGSRGIALINRQATLAPIPSNRPIQRVIRPSSVPLTTVIYILPQHRGHHTEPSSSPGSSAAPDTCKFPVENTATMKRTHTGLEVDEYRQGEASDSATCRSKVSRKIRACQQCHTRKIRCVTDDGAPKCIRCTKNGLECVVNKNLQDLLEGEYDWKKAMEQQMESMRASMVDMKAKLDNLQSTQQHMTLAITSPGTVSRLTAPTPHLTAMTRENSPETHSASKDDGAIVDAPMVSLFRATKLRNIRSDPSSDGRAALDRRHQPDFISQGRISLAEAEHLFSAFQGTLNAYLWGGVALVHDTLSSARESSSLLVAAILAVAALHTQDDGQRFDRCYVVLAELASQAMFQRYHTLDDIRGLCIGAFWLSDLSWKLSGLAVRIATELNIHQHCARALRGETSHCEKARLWYLLYVCDHHFSIAYGRPPVIAEDVTLINHEGFLALPGASGADMRLHSQVSIFIILSRTYRTFGLDRSRVVANDEFDAIRRYNGELGKWKQTWESRLGELVCDPQIGDYPRKGVLLHYHFARLLLFSVCLQGLRPTDSFLISRERQDFISTAVDSASAALRLILEDSDMRRAVVGVPLYLLTTIAYSSIFLIKVCSSWRAVVVHLSVDDVVNLVGPIISMLNATQAYARHVAHYIGQGLSTMLDRFKSGESARNVLMPQDPNKTSEVPQDSRPAQQQDWDLSYSWMMGDQLGMGLEYYPGDLLGIIGSQMAE